MFFFTLFCLGHVMSKLIYMPETPLQVQFSEDEDDRTYNLLASAMLVGSGRSNGENIAVDLSKTKWPSGKNMFNVTVLTPSFSKKLK